MKKRIYLDDLRTPIYEDWVIARSFEEFVKTVELIGLENIETISLDHDLGDSAMDEYFTNTRANYVIDYDNIKEKTGYDCAKWIVELSAVTNKPLPDVFVHSANPIGSANIMGYVNNYLKNCRRPQNCIRVKIEHTINLHGDNQKENQRQ